MWHKANAWHVQFGEENTFCNVQTGSLGKHGDGKRTRHLILGQFVKSRRIFLEFNSYPSLKREREFCVFTPSTQRRRSSCPSANGCCPQGTTFCVSLKEISRDTSKKLK